MAIETCAPPTHAECISGCRSDRRQQRQRSKKHLATPGLPAVSILLFAASALWGQSGGVINMSQDLIRLGISSSNLFPNQPTLDAGPLFLQSLNYAQAHGIATVVADPGAYYFLSEPQPFISALIDRISNLTIDFHGADLYFAAVNYGFIFSNCSNLVVQNFTVDRLQPGYTQLLITHVDPVSRQIQFTVQPGWQKPTALNSLLNNPAVVFSTPAQTDAFIFRNGGLWSNYTSMTVQQPFNDDHLTIASSNFLSSSLLSTIRPGDVAVLRVRVGVNAIVANCNSCTFRNIRIYSGLEGIDLDGSSNSVLERIYVMPKPGTDRLISTLADGTTLTQPGTGNIVRLSRSIRTLDDGISPHIWVWGSVQSVRGPRSALISAAGVTAMGQSRPLPNQSNVVFERGTDGTILGNAVVTSQTSITNVGGTNQATLAFDRDLPANITGAFVYATDPSWRGDGLRLERNTIQEQGFATGISLWGLMNTTLSGNYLRRTAMAGVEINHTLTSNNWLVPPVSGVTLTRNVIDGAPTELDNMAGLELGAVAVKALASTAKFMTTSPHQNLTFSRNFIANAARSAFHIGNTSGANVTDNYLLNPNSNPRQDRALMNNPDDFLKPIAIDDSVGVVTANNTIDTTSGRLWVTDTQYSVLAAYAPGSTIRLHAFSIGAVANPSLTLLDADGVSTTLKVQQSSTDYLDVQLPSSAALGGGVITLSAGSNSQWFATLFLDSADNLPALNGCTYEVSPSSASVASGATTFPVLVVTQPSCTYQILATDPALTAGGSASGTGVISVNVAVNTSAARTFTIEIAGLPITFSQAATVTPAITAIFDPWDYTVGLAPGAWITLTGTNLSNGPAQTWNLTGVQTLPVSIGGVSVTFNGVAGALFYVSPTQINVLVPASVTPGPVQIVVTSNNVSGTFAATATATLPSIYAVPNSDGSVFWVTAALAGTANLIGNPAVDSRTGRAARPGDSLDLYVVGLGATNDPAKFITDRIFTAAEPLAANVTATIGGLPAQVVFAGLTSPGLYLVRVVVPDAGSGPQPIQLTAGNLTSRDNLVLLMGGSAP